VTSPLRHLLEDAPRSVIRPLERRENRDTPRLASVRDVPRRGDSVLEYVPRRVKSRRLRRVPHELGVRAIGWIRAPLGPAQRGSLWPWILILPTLRRTAEVSRGQHHPLNTRRERQVIPARTDIPRAGRSFEYSCGHADEFVRAYEGRLYRRMFRSP